MSTHDEENKRQRGIKLCQLIHDRQIDSEIGLEIRKLLEEGVPIDYRDQNRNQKTAIHLAVAKCDVICVKFLLRFKPNLKVKDEDGKTPVELAESNDDKSILNALLNSTVDVVNESYVEVFDFESVTRQKIEAIKSRTSFKVLNLTNCPSANEVWKKLSDNDYAREFSESSHLFFIAIETKETNIENDLELMKKVLNVRRPMIVQLTSSNSQNVKIYFKDGKMKDFVEITDTPQINQEELQEAFLSKNECNFKLMVAALRSNLFGHFNGDLMHTKLNTSDDRSEAVNQFARSNALCHRFFKLFDDSSPQIDRIVAALFFEGDQSLLALLDLPFEPKKGKLKLNEYQKDILRVVDPCDYNLLMLAADQNNLNAVKLLMRCGCDFNHSDCGDKRASDICCDVKAFDCLAELIEAGSPYPNNFSAEKLSISAEASKRINAMTDAIDSFHEIIKYGKIEEVKKFISSHPNIKHAYDTSNKCALTVAVESGQVDIYSLLMSEGFEPGVDYDEYQSACSKSNFKNEIRNSHRKYFKEAFDELHLKRLVEKSKLSFGSKDRAKCSTIIRKMFDELNEIDEIIPILKICSTSDKLKIVFDFNCDSVVDMDATKESKSLGAVYPSDGFVYIGAKNYETEFFKVIGTLIHELSHYAMRLTYENSCKPYDVADIAQTNRFEIITRETKKICDENPSTDSIVSTVFTCYTESVWHAELIVRVPQLLAHFKMNPTALEASERITPELFHFYREKTLEDVERQSKVLLQKYLISKINKQTGIARKIANLNVMFENVEIDLKPSVNVITSNAPQLTLAMLNQVFPSESHIFVTLEQVAIGNVLNKIAKINARQSSTALIVDCNGLAQKYSESLKNFPKKLKNMKTIALVITELEGSAAKENISKVEHQTFTHKWDELTESTKVNLLNKLVVFQGIEMTLSWLVGPSSEAMNFFPLGEILNVEDFEVGKTLHKPSHSYYIPRDLRKKDPSTANDDTESDQNDFNKSQVVIISDEAGSGKSVALFEIAKSLHDEFHERCILFVDLKRHIKAFETVEDYETIKTFQDFIVQHILKNEAEFDRELFMQMFRDGKTFVLFDGLDEISPNFKDLLLHVLKLFVPGSCNRLYITTRPHLEADLEEALGKFVFKLEELSEQSQKSYLEEYWKSISLKSEGDLEVLSERLLKKFSDISISNFIGLPLLLRMTAEIFSDPTKENSLDKLESLNVASIFNEFVNKYLAWWKEGGSGISLKENVEIDRDGGILEIHHSIAIKHKFGDKFAVLKFDECDAEKIARVGLIRYDKNKKTFQFIHETFAEYFVADFIGFHLNRKNRNPSHNCRLAIEILIEVMEDVYSYPVIHTILDQTLETTKFILNDASCQSLGKCLSEVVDSQNDFAILWESLYSNYNDNENILVLLLSILKYADKNVLLKILQSEDESSGKTALHKTAQYKCSKIVSTLCNMITTRVDNPKRIFQQISNASDGVLFLAAENKNRGVLTALCEVLNTVFTRYEIKIMFQPEVCFEDSLFGFATRESSNEVFIELLSLLPNYFSVEELKKLLTVPDHNNRICLQYAAAHCTKERVQRIIAFAKSIFEAQEDQKTFFFQHGFRGRNIFHYAAKNENEKIFQTIIESTCDVLSSDDFKSMLIEKDSEGSNVLHMSAKYGNEIMLKELNSLLRGVFKEDEIKRMLMAKDSEGSNVLHMNAKYGNEIMLKELNSVLREYLSDDDIRSLLLEVNEKGENCFRLAANSTSINFKVFLETIGNVLPEDDQTRLLQESFREIDIFRLASGNYTGEDVPIETIKYLLTKKDLNGKNAFQNAAFKWSVDSVKRWNRLVVFLQARFSGEEMKIFLIEYDRDGESCFHLAVANKWHGARTCKAVCNTFESVLSVEEQRKIVQQNYFDQKSLFHHAAKDHEILKLVIEYLRAILSRDELEAMLKQEDSDGRNILFYSSANSKALNTLIDVLPEILSKDEIKGLLLDEDCEGQNCFQYSVRFECINSDEIISMSNFIKSILNPDDKRKFFGSKNLFHLTAKNRNFHLELFSTVHGCLKGVFTDVEVKFMIQEKDSSGNNILHLICQSDEYVYDYVLVDLFKILKDVLDADELKDFLTSSNHHGSNCLLLAVKIGPTKYLNKLFRLIQAELSIDDLRKMIQKSDNDSNNIFKCASQHRGPKIFPLVKLFAKKYLTEDQFVILYDEFATG